MAKARSYAKMRGEFWTGETGRRLRREAPECQVVAAYLAFNRHASAIGIYHLPVALVAIETGRSEESIRRALEVLAEEDYAHYDEDREEIFVVNAAREQIGHELKANDNQCRFVAEELHLVRRSKFARRFVELYGEAFHLDRNASPFESPSKPLQSPSKAPSEGGLPPLRSHEQEQEQLQLQQQQQPQLQEQPDSSDEESAPPAVEGPKKTPQAKFVDDCWAIYDAVEAARPTGGLLVRWRKDHFAGDSGWMLRALDDLARQGYLARGDAYVAKSLAGKGQRGDHRRPALELVAPERSSRPKVGDLDRSGKFRFDGTDWEPVVATGGSDVA